MGAGDEPIMLPDGELIEQLGIIRYVSEDFLSGDGFFF
jgi:hypothetical protein